MSANGEIRSYRDLLVWQKGMALAKQIYAMTRAFPGDERFGLTAQMRRAVVSVPSNIAEGQARHGRREFVQFLSHCGRLISRTRHPVDVGGGVGILSPVRCRSKRGHRRRAAKDDGLIAGEANGASSH